MDYNRTSIRSVGEIPKPGTPPATARAVASSAITLSGTQTIDGVSLAAGDTCLVTAQATASDNGLYVVASSAWTRTDDLIKSGMIVSVREGGNGFTLWTLVTAAPIGVGPIGITGGTAQTWAKLTIAGGPDVTWANVTSNMSSAPSGYPTIDGVVTISGTTALLTNPTMTGGYPGLWLNNTGTWNPMSQPYACVILEGTVNAGVMWYDSNPKRTAPPDPIYVSSGGTLSAALLKANNLSDLASASTARTNLGLGTAATTASSAYDVAGAASTAQAAAIAASCQRANNLSDVASVSTARTNLGLGTAATKNTGTTAGNVVVLDGSAKLPAVDGSQLTNLPAAGGGLLAANNLSDVSSASTSRTNLGLGTAATHDATDFDASGSAALVLGVAALKANNLSDLASASSARTNLGLGTAATNDVGTSANNVVQLDGSAKLPAVDGSQLTNLPGGTISYQGATGSGTLPATGTWGDGANISLTAGDWDISAVLCINTNNGSTQSYYLGISSTSGNNAPSANGDNLITLIDSTKVGGIGGTIPCYRVQPGSTTTYYLKVKGSYTGTGTPTFTCRLSARKMG